VEAFARSVGRTRAELSAVVSEVADSGLDRVRFAGLVKLLEDRCEIEAAPPGEAERLREAVHRTAHERRRALGLREVLDRDEVLARCAAELGLEREALEREMFSDLPEAQRVLGFEPLAPRALLERYDLGLAQGVLLRASRVVLELAPSAAVRYRAVLRAIKFHRLMHRISGTAESGYRIELDGPLSLFEATHRYGVQLAMLLPAVVAGDDWRLEAEVLWGKARERLRLELSSRDGLVSHARAAPAEPEEVEALARSFERLESDWKLGRTATLFDLGGRGVFVPDLVFEHARSGKRVFLEVFGFWSRDAVFQRVEALEAHFPHAVVLAVSRRLRVSPEIASETFPGRILVYTGSISARAVREALDEVAREGAG
jgi:predicted nuclease of restriction endonuclease-like RecB superfamily